MPIGAGPAYNATWYHLIVHNESGLIGYEKEECAPCGGWWNGYIYWNGIWNTGSNSGRPSSSDMTYDWRLELGNCTGTRTVTGFFMNQGVRAMQILTDTLPGMSDEEHVSIYPNPSNGIYIINTNAGSEIRNIVVTDVLGRAVKSVREINLTTSFIDLQNEINGIYFFKIETDKGAIVRRVIKQ
jgi:hypothetical protein